MQTFAHVGRRLRRYRFMAYLFFLIAALICAVGLGDYIDNGPPRRWTRNDATSEWGYVAIPRTDPLYEEIVNARWRELMLFLLWGGGAASAAAVFLAFSRYAPTKEILLLAQARNGLITLPDVSTSLDIDPHLAARALRQLQKLHIACPRWQEYRKNLWEFPDYVQLPIGQSIDFAHKTGGRITLKDLLAQGHSLDTAQQTLATLSREGLAQSDPQDAQSLIVAAAQ